MYYRGSRDGYPNISVAYRRKLEGVLKVLLTDESLEPVTRLICIQTLFKCLDLNWRYLEDGSICIYGL